MRITSLVGTINTALPTNGPLNVWPGVVDSVSTKFSWWSVAGATSYNVYRHDISTTVPIHRGVVPTISPGAAIAQLFYADFISNPDTAPNTINPATAYTYSITGVIGGLETQHSAPLVLTTLASGPGATLPIPATDPVTYDPGPPVFPAGTVWTCTNTANTAVTGTGTLGNAGCSVQWALNGSNINGGDVIVLTAGATYPVPNANGYTMPAYTGTSGVTYFTTSEDPLVKVGGKLPAYVSGASPNYSTFTLTALPAAGAVTATLTAVWTARNAYLPVLFYTTAPPNFETRLVHFVNGSATINWNTALLGTGTQTAIRVHQGQYVTPDDIAGSMPTIQFGNVNGSGMTIPPLMSNVRLVGINIAPTPGAYTTNANGTACVLANNYPFPTSNPQYTSVATNVTWDRCCFGNDPTGANYSYVKRAIDANGNFFVVHQCFMHGFFSGAQGGDTQAYYCQGSGPHLIQNSYLDAGAENFFTGGVYTPQPQIPHDITLRWNYSHKNGGINGTTFAREYKNHFETKVGQRFHIHHNIFQNGWYSFAGAGQNGRVGQMGPLDQFASVTARTVNSLTFAAGIATATCANLGPVPVGTTFISTLANVTSPAGLNGPIAGTITSFTQSTTTFQFPCDQALGTGTATLVGGAPPTSTNILTFPETTNPWSIVSDGDIHDNQCYGFAQPFYFHGESTTLNQSGRAMRFRCANNLIWLNPSCTDSNATTSLVRGLQVAAHCPDVTFDQNTVIEIPQNTGYLSAGSGFFTSGLEFFSQSALGAPNYSWIDRCVITNNILDGGRGFNVSSVNGQTYQAQGVVAIGNSMLNPTFSNNLMILDASSYVPYEPAPPAFNPIPYANVGFSNFVANTFMPASPQDWNVVTGTYATASTTGGPIGVIPSTGGAPLINGTWWSANSPWNVKIPAGAFTSPIQPATGAVITAYSNATGQNITNAFNVTTGAFTANLIVAPAGTPTRTWTFTYQGISHTFAAIPATGTFATMIVNAEAWFASPGGDNSDRSINLYSTDQNVMYDIYPDGTGQPRGGNGPITITTASMRPLTGTGWWNQANFIAAALSSGTASGACQVGGSIKPSEWTAAQTTGIIPHALMGAWPAGGGTANLSGANQASPDWGEAMIFPARGGDGGNFNDATGNKLPEGARLQLDPSLTDAQLLGFGVTTAMLPVCHTLQQYGWYNMDIDGNFPAQIKFLSTNPNSTAGFNGPYSPAPANLPMALMAHMAWVHGPYIVGPLGVAVGISVTDTAGTCSYTTNYGSADGLVHVGDTVYVYATFKFTGSPGGLQGFSPGASGNVTFWAGVGYKVLAVTAGSPSTFKLGTLAGGPITSTVGTMNAYFTTNGPLQDLATSIASGLMSS